MILYAAYVKGDLVDQVAAENEDTAFALLKMDYPDVKKFEYKDIKFEIIDGNHQPTREQEEAVAAVIEKTAHSSSSSATTPPIKVIEAAEIHITINIMEGTLSEEDLRELERAQEEGMVIAKKKGS